jgi:hypothetical protein
MEGVTKACVLNSTQRLNYSKKADNVRYESAIPAIDVVRVFVDRDPEWIQRLFRTKSESWAYEREWRVLHTNGGTKFRYPREALTGVYFGPDIEERDIEIVCLIRLGQNDHVRFYRGTRSNSEFRVEFQQLNFATRS